MGRRKLELGLIESKKTRSRTFTSRKNGIIKKAMELSVLCDVDVGVIIFGPNGGDKPYVWPQETQKLNHILLRYQTTSQEERQRRATILSSVSSSTEGDAQNVEIEFVNGMGTNPTWDDHIDGCSAEELLDLISCLDFKIRVVEERIDMIRSSHSSTQFDVQEVQSCGSEEQDMMTMTMLMGVQPGSFHWEYQPHDHQNVDVDQQRFMMMSGGSCCNPTIEYVDDHQYVNVGEQKSADLMMMMMMNGGGCCNPTNADMGDCTGLMGNNESYYLGKTEDVNGGGMLNSNPMTWCYENDTITQTQLQQLNDDQMPFYA